MDLQGLKRHKEKTGYTLAQAELDYYQHLILGKVYEKYNTIYFKGGTALQKCYGIKRFSEDLDFNYTGIDLEVLRGFIEKILNGKTIDHHENNFNTSFTIRFAGILYDGDQRSMCKITFDFRNGDIHQEPLKKVIRPPYEDLDTYFLLALSTEEILAEKIRAIIEKMRKA